jgi:hypothetical protein
MLKSDFMKLAEKYINAEVDATCQFMNGNMNSQISAQNKSDDLRGQLISAIEESHSNIVLGA